MSQSGSALHSELVQTDRNSHERLTRQSDQVHRYLRHMRKTNRRRKQSLAIRPQRNRTPRNHVVVHEAPRSDTATQDSATHNQESGWVTRTKCSFEKFAELENSPWIQQYKDDFEDEGGLVACFMKDPESVSQRKEQAKWVLEFCSDQALQELELGSQLGLLEKTCLLDDRSNDGKDPISRGYYGPLTRFVSKSGNCDQTSSSTDDKNATCTGQSKPGVNADRRLIYMADLNPWGMMALMTTASRTDAAVLRGAFYRHLSFKSNISIRPMTGSGFQFYELSFDFPFFAWRTRSARNKPPKPCLKLDGSPVRKVAKLSFLERETPISDIPTEVDYICPAYGFFDTYFDSEEERESAQKYHEDMGLDDEGHYDGLQVDPLTHGTCDANKPLLNAVEYFWFALGARIKQANAEWHLFVDNLEDRIQTYIDSCQLDSKSTGTSTVTVQESCDWVRDIRKSLLRWTDTLTANIKAWTSFKLNKKFSTEHIDRQMTWVEYIFRDLETCVDKLRSLRDLCNCHASNLKLYMSGEGNRDSKIQTETARSSHTLTNFGLFWVYPTTLAAAMLSMQEKAIPSILGPAKLSFPALTVFLTAVVFFLFALLDRWPVIKRWVLETRKNLKEFRAHADDLESGNREN
ncbi:hypothetical protein B0J13DRAFT_534178 [Dactylonectria estremocensis]|uniref:Uncharacterized protein n=1 Tax=Dactylonectria estremocensis TaxID=1079267 RepID=A0A9P9D3F4_9HYPO|nr:hypothetical protein B0J13DRAFT_534178 [Dactylonectria estremocensis]